MKDDFVKYFVGPSSKKKGFRRASPLINRGTLRDFTKRRRGVSRNHVPGTFARTFAIETATRDFLRATEKKCQIINLGAGSSTLFWRLKSEKVVDSSAVTFFEVDFKDTVDAKRKIIESRSELSLLTKEGYVLVSADLRDMKGVQKCLEDEGKLRADLPTLLISECTYKSV